MIEIKIEPLSKSELARVATCSLERVLNTAIEIISKHNKDDRYTDTLEDLEDLKPFASRLWYAASSQAQVQL